MRLGLSLKEGKAAILVFFHIEERKTKILGEGYVRGLLLRPNVQNIVSFLAPFPRLKMAKTANNEEGTYRFFH